MNKIRISKDPSFWALLALIAMIGYIVFGSDK